METPASIPHRRRSDRVLVGLFLLILCLPLLDLGFHIDPTRAPSENRLLAEFPQRPHRLTEMKPFLTGVETYFNDHFGCRRCLVMWNNKLKWALFRSKDTRNTLIGSNGWMYFSAAQMVEHFRGALLFSDQELRDWQKLLEHRRDWLAHRNIKYLFVVAPDKQSIYPEYLPAWLKDIGGRTKLDQFLDYMHAHSTVEILDLRPALLAHKDFAPLYQKTDTHWNQLGAFFAYQSAVQILTSHQLPGLPVVSLDQFNYTNQLAPGGDMARDLGINMAESNAFFLTPKTSLPALETFEPTGKQVKDMCYAKNPQGRGRAIVYHDSFGRYWVPFLGYQFNEVDFFWQYNLDPAVIEREKPVVVINEMLERFFNLDEFRIQSDQFVKSAIPTNLP